MPASTLLRRAAVLTVAVVVTSGASQALADTAVTGDDRQPGRHDIVRLVVDNTGDRVGATVLHRSGGWQGSVAVGLDVRGGPAPEYRAVIPHARRGKVTYRRGNGSRWTCADRTAVSPVLSRRTTLSVARRCVEMAPKLRVRAVAGGPGLRDDVAVSRQVVQQRRPNIVMIMVDDMRADELRYMPWTRRLIADRGVTWRNAFAPFPLCCPARASLLSGKYAHNHQVLGVHAPWGFTSFNDRSTLATWLQRAGYATAYLGKYFNGYGIMPEPGRRRGRSVSYVPPGWNEWRASIDGGLPASHPKQGSTYWYNNTTLSNDGNGFSNYRGRYQSTVYGDLSASIIRRRAASDKPFFLVASYTAPHNGAPYEDHDPRPVIREDGKRVEFGTPAVPNYLEGRFDRRIRNAPGYAWNTALARSTWHTKSRFMREMPEINNAERLAMRELARQRAEAVYAVDQSVKRTVDALRASGELEETMVVFTSDNGYFLGEQRIRQDKKLPYDPSLRVPLVMRGPGIPAGQDRLDPFLTIDFAPTFMRLAGALAPASVDGASMLKAAREGDRGWRRPVLTETGPNPKVRFKDDPTTLQGLDAQMETRRQQSIIGVRTDRYLYLSLTSGEEELYDMAVDRRQYENLVTDEGVAEGYEQTIEQLRAVYRERVDCVGEECRTPMGEPELVAPAGRSVMFPRS